MAGRAFLGLMTVGLALTATPALACRADCISWPPAPVYAADHGHLSAGYGAAYSRSGERYSRSVEVSEYGAGRHGYVEGPIDYTPGDEPRDFDPPSAAYESRYDEGGYALAGGPVVREDHYRREDYRSGSYRTAAYHHGAGAPCPQAHGPVTVRCVFRPIYEEIRIDTGIFDGGVGVIPMGGGGGGGGVVVVDGGFSAGARGSAFASASASASASVTVSGGFRGGGGGHKGGHKGGGCSSCGGGHGGKGGKSH